MTGCELGETKYPFEVDEILDTKSKKFLATALRRYGNTEWNSLTSAIHGSQQTWLRESHHLRPLFKRHVRDVAAGNISLPLWDTVRLYKLHLFWNQLLINYCYQTHPIELLPGELFCQVPECAFPTQKHFSTNNIRTHVQQHGVEVGRDAYNCHQSMQSMQQSISEYFTTSQKVVTNQFRFLPQSAPLPPHPLCCWIS